MVASPASVKAGWAAEVALEVAQGWGSRGARLVLADGGIGVPQLQQALGLPPGEGLVDALRWGASVQRVARRPEGRPFFVISAGTAVADAAGVLRTSRWPALCTGFTEAGVTLAVLVPLEDPCLAGVLEQATHAVVLAGPDESLEEALAGFGGSVLSVLGRATEIPPAEPEAHGSAPDVEELEEGDSFLAPAAGIEPEEDVPGVLDAGADPEVDLPVAPIEAFAPDPDVFAPLPEDAEAPEPPGDGPESPVGDVPLVGVRERRDVPSFEEIVEESRPRLPARPKESRARPRTPGSSRRRGPLFTLLALLVVVAGVLIAGWLGFLDIPGIPSRGAPAESDLPAPPPSALAAGPAQAEAHLLAYFLAVGAYQEAASAQTMVVNLTEAAPDVVVTIVPVEVQGSAWHRVLLGPAADSLAAMELGARVAGAAGLDAAPWVPRWAPMAFQLGEAADLEAAHRRREVLAGLDIPAYVLAVNYSDGSTRFRVYAGAFADEAEASLLSGLLVERGLSPATFSDRIGRLPE